MRDALLHRYLGPPNDFVAMKNLSNYNTTASPERVYGWWPGTCSTGYNYICEVPLSSYQCPPSPPQSPAPPPDIYACEGPGQAGRLPLCHTNSQFVCTANNAFRVFNFCNDPPQSQTEFLQLAATAIALIAMPCHAKHHKPMMVQVSITLHHQSLLHEPSGSQVACATVTPCVSTCVQHKQHMLKVLQLAPDVTPHDQVHSAQSHLLGWNSPCPQALPPTTTPSGAPAT
jgi:hypothetical protein